MNDKIPKLPHGLKVSYVYTENTYLIAVAENESTVFHCKWEGGELFTEIKAFMKIDIS